jgi:subtilisin-like proprotein convertase family protein
MNNWWRGSLAAFGLLASGAASAVSINETAWDFVYTAGPGLGLAIPDNDPTGASSTISVGDDYIISRVALIVTLDHTWVGDLIFTLTGPDGTAVTLADRPGSSDPADFGDSSNLSTLEPIIFGDLSPTPAENMGGGACTSTDSTVGADCTRWFNPDVPLSDTFAGSSALGDWILTISDNAGADLGTLDKWLIAFQVQAIPLPPAVWLFASGILMLIARRRA